MRLMLVCLTAIASVVYPQPEIERLERLHREDRFIALEQELPDVERRYINHPTVLYFRALLEEDGEKARDLYSRVYQAHGTSKYADDALFRIGQYYYARGQYHRARNAFSVLARSYSGSSIKDDSQYLICQSLLAEGKSDSARLFFYTFVRNSPDSPYSDLAILDLEYHLGGAPDLSVESHPYAVQVGAFSKWLNAKKAREKCHESGLDAGIVPIKRSGRTLYAVRIGQFNSREEAARFAMRYFKEYHIVDRRE